MAQRPIVKVSWARHPAGQKLVLGAFDHRPTSDEVENLRTTYPAIEFNTTELVKRRDKPFSPKAYYQSSLTTEKPAVKLSWFPQPLNIGPIQLWFGSFDHRPTPDEIDGLQAAYPYIEFEPLSA